MSRVKYPNKREIEAQVKQIIVRSDIFSGANQEYEAEDFEPVRRKTSYYKLAIKTGVAVAFAAVMFMLLKPVFDSANLNSSQALNNGADYDDNLGVETETDNQDWKTGDEADTDAETVGSNENESATFGSSYDETATSGNLDIFNSNYYSLTVGLSAQNIIVEEDGEHKAISISMLLPVALNKNGYGNYINSFYRDRIMQITSDIQTRYSISEKQRNELSAAEKMAIVELDLDNTIYNLQYESGELNDINTGNLYDGQITTKGSLIVNMYSNYIKSTAISDKVVSFCDTYTEYTVGGDMTIRTYGNNFNLDYKRTLRYSDILKDYESGMQTIAEHVYEQLKPDGVMVHRINNEKYGSVEAVLEMLKEENNWFFTDDALMICCNDYETSILGSGVNTYTENQSITVGLPFELFDIIKDEYKSEKYPELINTQKMYLPEGITK